MEIHADAETLFEVSLMVQVSNHGGTLTLTGGEDREWRSAFRLAPNALALGDAQTGSAKIGVSR